MKLTLEEKQKLEDLYQQYLNDERVQKMKLVPMHRGSNCYYHSFKVARKAIKHALRYKKADLEVILLGAILHDYYLYDWRKEKDKKRHHGSRHPYIAAKQAAEDFGIPEKVQDIIMTHMWPLNFLNPPHTREALILSWSDKLIATREALTSKRHKSKKEGTYCAQIAKLFDK